MDKESLHTMNRASNLPFLMERRPSYIDQESCQRSVEYLAENVVVRFRCA